MSKLKRIAILTGGGDCPGLNPAIRAATRKAIASGIDVVGIKDGWKGMLAQGQELTTPLDLDTVRHIDRQGGTILGTSRTNPYKESGGIQKVKARFEELMLDGLIAIGGEDTLGVASRLYEEEKHAIVAIPKTIDRDLPGTEYTLGFESALQVITECVDSLRSTAESHARVFVVEIMGRHAGHLALRGGISAGADVILIPEFPFEMQKVCELLAKRKEKGLRYSIVFVAEGARIQGESEVTRYEAKDAFGHIRLGGIGDYVAREIEKLSKIESRCVNLSHLQRGGRPVAFDRRMGFYFGTAAVEAMLQDKFGSLVALKSGRVSIADLSEVRASWALVDVEKSYDKVRYRAAKSVLGDNIL